MRGTRARAGPLPGEGLRGLSRCSQDEHRAALLSSGDKTLGSIDRLLNNLTAQGMRPEQFVEAVIDAVRRRLVWGVLSRRWLMPRARAWAILAGRLAPEACSDDHSLSE